MSLQVWIPFTDGTLKQQGLSDATVSSAGTINLTNAGKLGKCITFTSTAGGLTIPPSTMTSFTDACSVSFWFKINDWGTSYATYFQAGTGSTPWNNYIFGFLRYASNSTICFTISNGSSASNGSYLTSTMSLGVWYHVAITYETGKCKIYLNGELDHEYTTTIVPAFNKITKISVGRSNADSSYQTQCNMNDLRIYDHCLSPMEINELSKGLMLHYPLNRNGFGQENIFLNSSLTDLTSENLSTKIRYANPYVPVITEDGLKFTWSGSSAREVDLYLGSNLDTNTYYTLSFIYRSNMNIGSSFYLRNGNTLVGYWSQTTIPYSENWSTYKCTFKPTSYQGADVTTGDSLTLFYSGYTENKWIELKKSSIKLEKGTVATPWCLNISDDLATNIGLDSTIEYDCSGFGNNGVLNGINEYTSDTIRYNVSRIFNGVNNPVTLPNLSTLISDGIFTFSVWFKKETDQWSSKSWETIFGGPSGFEFSSKSGSTNSPVLYAYSWNKGTYNYTLDEWHHFVMVRTTSGTIFYLDGVQAFTGTAGSIPSGNYFLGAWSTITGQNYKGKMSDARIYATALSEDDIQSLYADKGYIDNKGNVYGTLHEIG